MGKLTPNYRFRSIYDITPAFVHSLSLRGLILDIDNTLVFYGVHKATEENRAWIRGMEAEGIKIAFVSNGYKERVTEYNEEFGYHCSYKSGKPAATSFIKAADIMGVIPRDMAVVGDQIFTDIWGGNNAGMTTILVDPIEKEPWLSFKIKRFIEKPLLAFKKYTEVK